VTKTPPTPTRTVTRTSTPSQTPILPVGSIVCNLLGICLTGGFG
jgi:hypothetical protein